MSILSLLPGDNIICRNYKSLIANPERVWVNTYEFTCQEAAGYDACYELLQAILSFEKNIHYDNTTFIRASCSTWVPDTHPYDPTAFIVLDWNGQVGDRVSAGQQMLPLETSWSVKRNVQGGRSGKLFYRGLLTEADIVSVAGYPALADPTAMAATLSVGLSTSSLDNYIGVNNGTEFFMSMVGQSQAGVTQTRMVTNLASKGVAFVNMNHRWYDRTASMPGGG